MTLNDAEWLFHVKFCFAPVCLASDRETFENNCVKTNKDCWIAATPAAICPHRCLLAMVEACPRWMLSGFRFYVSSFVRTSAKNVKLCCTVCTNDINKMLFSSLFSEAGRKWRDTQRTTGSFVHWKVGNSLWRQLQRHRRQSILLSARLWVSIFLCRKSSLVKCIAYWNDAP